MKVKNLRLGNFKRFSGETFDFCDSETGLARDLIVIVGRNGSGKSTILQAISVMLATATKRLSEPAELNWPGFSVDLANEAWDRPIEMELDVEFAQNEIEATREYFSRAEKGREGAPRSPGRSPVVRLKYIADSKKVEAGNAEEMLQFLGYSYARALFKHAKKGASLFESVGDVFWYTEERTTNSLTPLESNGRTVKYDMGLLRRRLSDLCHFHERIRRGEYELKPGQRDLFADIEKAFRTIFPTQCLEGPVPPTGIDDVLEEPWFYLFDGRNRYEISEMSAGERAIFPMIFDFATRGIHNSVILIDELELHLHPPHQQGMLKALRKLGKNNQFIITTHSDAVEAIVPPDAIHRL